MQTINVTNQIILKCGRRLKMIDKYSQVINNGCAEEAGNINPYTKMEITALTSTCIKH